MAIEGNRPIEVVTAGQKAVEAIGNFAESYAAARGKGGEVKDIGRHTLFAIRRALDAAHKTIFDAEARHRIANVSEPEPSE